MIEQLDYNLLFRWFVGLRWMMSMGRAVFTKNRERLMDGEVSQGLLASGAGASGRTIC